MTVNDPWGYGASLEWATSCPPPRHNFTSIPRIRSERPAFDLNHPEAGIPVGVGPAKDAPAAPVVDLDEEMVRLAARGTGKDAPPIVLRADKRLAYGRVMTVMAALNRAGLNKISLVTSGTAGNPAR